MKSIWTQTANSIQFNSLKQNIKTDVLIIGGGISGILCAYMLKQAGIDYLLVEANEIGHGITGCTTAKITAQHGFLFDTLIRRFGVETARLYWESQLTALEKYRAICQRLDCDFQDRDSFVYSMDENKVEKELMALKNIGCAAEAVSKVPLPFSIAGAVCVRRQAQFHPLKFIYALAKDLNILEHTKVRELSPGEAITEHGSIKASRIIVTTHFPILNKHGNFFLKLYQHRSYVIALKGAPQVNGMFVDENEKGLSFRNYKDLLLLGGGSHRTGKEGGNWDELLQFAEKHYPGAKEVCRYATQDCMTLDGIPYIGQYSKSTPHLFTATGFNKWGMTSAMVAATLITDLIQGKSSPIASIYSPSRSIWRPQLAVNTIETIASLLTFTSPRCPHLGCALKYNKSEHSWDCPCHGSRFSENGSLIDNPATDDMQSL